MDDVPDDLSREAVETVLPNRALRTYPAILSTESEAMSWARKGAPGGGLVVAGYQASPRGRSGLAWGDHLEPGHGLGFSLILRPDLPDDREGWLYTVGLLGVADVLEADGVVIEWPDEVCRDGEMAGAVSVQVEPGGGRLRWGVVNVIVPDAEPPRTELLGRLVEAIESRADTADGEVLEDYRARCGTLGREVRAKMLPLGPSAPRFLGEAVDVVEDGGLVIRTEDGERVVVQPQALGFLEDPDAAAGPPGEI